MNKKYARKLILSCSVTESHIKEFLLLKFSVELFRNCCWYLSCDKYSFDLLNKEDNCFCENLNLENGKVFGNEKEVSNFYGVIKGKFEATKRAINDYGECLLVDSDIIFCGELQDFAVGIDAAVCPHYQWHPEMDKAWGLYNVGFVYIKNIEFLQAWEQETFSGNYEFEQKPIQSVVEYDCFKVQRLPIQHNMGWWRFNSAEKRVRANSFDCWNDSIWFDGNLVSSFHFHSFVECNHSQPLKDFVFKRLLPNTSSGKQIIEEYNRLKLWSGH
jgi:hypothetical protein